MKPFLIGILVLVGAILLSVAVGAVPVPLLTLAGLFYSRLPGATLPDGWLEANQTLSTILFDIRLPRTVLVALTGLALSGSGAAYQGLFRNPLADPYLIGVASGAGLGAIVAMAVRWPYSTLGLLAIPMAAFMGAVLTVVLVYTLARVGRTVPTTNLILAGVAVGSFCSAVTSFIMLQSQGELRRAVAWLLGGGAISGWSAVLACLPYVILGSGIIFWRGHTLNVLQFGDEQAQQMGVDVEKTRRTIIIAASLMTAAAVAFSGIIGFIGLVVPHLVRMVWGPDYRRLIPASFIWGAGLLLIADVLARVILAPQDLPVGVITALFGAPFFLWILRRTRAQAFW